MASPRSSRSSSARSSGGRGRASGSSDSSQMMVYVGAFAVVVIIVFFVMRSGGDKGSGQEPTAPAAAGTPTPAAQPKPAINGTAKVGKKPDRPAPPLTADTLAKLDDLLEKAKGFYNEGRNLREAGDNRGARDQQTKANDVLQQWTDTVKDQLAWQEEAGLGDWEQPAEYVALESRYAKFSQLQRSVQLNGANK